MKDRGKQANKTDINLIKAATTPVKARQSHYGSLHYVALCNLVQLYPNCSRRGQTGAADTGTDVARSDTVRRQRHLPGLMLQFSENVDGIIK